MSAYIHTFDVVKIELGHTTQGEASSWRDLIITDSEGQSLHLSLSSNDPSGKALVPEVNPKRYKANIYKEESDIL